ncbi:MAG: adenosylmethionine--8-amino-7-oxononanoate transaminase [Myxococcota bacterium]
MGISREDLQFDRDHIWHPYTSATDPLPVYSVVEAEGVELVLDDGRRLIDGMASWWCAIHGYGVPELDEAARGQLEDMSHVMFGGVTHQPAIDLSRQLVDMTPAPLQRVFLADSGSVSVEVALKMAIQYWEGRGEPGRKTFLTVKHGYHGDTFGAMSVCDPENGMHGLFSGFMAENVFLDAPPAGFDRAPQPGDFDEIERVLEERGDEIAALILEPVVQGAGGMRFYSPEWLAELVGRCRERGILFIADEIATGFGRSGELFGCDHAGISPDIMCVGKAMTGGYMTMAAALCTDEVAETVCESEAGVFMHGPTFMANPLACAVSKASIELLLSRDWKGEVERLEAGLRGGLSPCEDMDGVRDVRVQGAIGVVETEEAVDVATMQKAFVERGVWIRPFGRLVYVMPPYVMSDDQLEQVTRAMVEVLGG